MSGQKIGPKTHFLSQQVSNIIPHSKPSVEIKTHSQRSNRIFKEVQQNVTAQTNGRVDLQRPYKRSDLYSRDYTRRPAWQRSITAIAEWQLGGRWWSPSGAHRPPPKGRPGEASPCWLLLIGAQLTQWGFSDKTKSPKFFVGALSMFLILCVPNKTRLCAIRGPGKPSSDPIHAPDMNALDIYIQKW